MIVILVFKKSVFRKKSFTFSLQDQHILRKIYSKLYCPLPTCLPGMVTTGLVIF